MSPDPLTDVDLVYALKASVEVLAAPDGQVYLLRPSTSDLAVPEPDATDRALLESLCRPSTIDALAQECGVFRASDPG